MTTLCSYDLNGKKLSFANWISNLSPQETPFSSMTGKESINQTLFQWQTDALAKAGKNANVEGGTATEDAMKTTSVKSNITQILRKTVKVSDTANAMANYGRGRELQYQMEKAGKEIKRDLEFAFLNNAGSVQEDTAHSIGRQTAGFRGLVAASGVACPETGAIVHASANGNIPTEAEIFNMTYNLYLAGSNANIIMFHPKFASLFSGLQEKSNTRERIFQNTPKFSVYVSVLVDPLGQEYKLIPNRWMPQDAIYFFNSADWTQMVLRAPSRTKLAKDGSYEKWMIEMEVGLRHRHPYASGILETADSKAHVTADPIKGATIVTTTLSSNNVFDTNFSGVAKIGETLEIKASGTAGGANDDIISVLKDGNSVATIKLTGATTASQVLYSAPVTPASAGIYSVQIFTAATGVTSITKGFALTVQDADGNLVAGPINA